MYIALPPNTEPVRELEEEFKNVDAENNCKGSLTTAVTANIKIRVYTIFIINIYYDFFTSMPNK